MATPTPKKLLEFIKEKNVNIKKKTVNPNDLLTTPCN
ncbi:hypothetical protein ANME2D_00010 [Candidatus Methanoperedens nitroreducens]|uniref:Uncharacterized protein n=1 Tax=Candidatus Methanoperedens nitratireducens TaxID=1392998 RepID=A0A062V6P3_9EURY|nr:hypothetical protein ANME2D_00010 [Candidatus Methanoperedens nitroreducens]